MNLRPRAAFLALLAGCSQQPPLRGSGDLGVLIERADGSVQILDGTAKTCWRGSKASATCPTPPWCSPATSATPTYSVATAA